MKNLCFFVKDERKGDTQKKKRKQIFCWKVCLAAQIFRNGGFSWWHLKESKEVLFLFFFFGCLSLLASFFFSFLLSFVFLPHWCIEDIEKFAWQGMPSGQKWWVGFLCSYDHVSLLVSWWEKKKEINKGLIHNFIFLFVVLQIFFFLSQ